MGIVVEFFQWLFKVLGKGLQMLASVPGIIIAALSSFAVAVANFYGNTEIAQSVASLLDRASTQIVAFVTAITPESDMGKEVLSLFAVDQLLAAFTASFSATVGAMVLVFFGLIGLCITYVITIYSCRMILKILQVTSGGVVDA